MTTLDKSQREFCSVRSGYVRLLAPAGSGKTISLLHRCLELSNASPKANARYLIFTFTNAAKEELLDRLSSDAAFRELASKVQVTTLNSWGWKLVRGSSRSAKILSARKEVYFLVQNVLQPVWNEFPSIRALLEDSRRRTAASHEIFALTNQLKSLAFRHDRSSKIKPFLDHAHWLEENGVGSQVDALINGLTEMEIVSGNTPTMEAVHREFIPFWIKACEQLRNSSLYSLEDQKYWAYIEMSDQIEKQKKASASGRIEHVFVDEFQDINPLDLRLIKSIVDFHGADLTIVGDDDQAIYEWRGASPEFILQPERFFGKQFRSSVLGVNYRSPRNIVARSQALISNNSRRVPKEVRAANSKDALIEVHRYSSVSQSIENTVSLVKSLLETDDCNKIALIGRKRSQIIPYQIVFAGHNMPFYAAEDLHVMLSEAFREMKSLLAIRGRAVTESYYDQSPVDDILTLCDKVKRYPLAKKDRELLRKHLYSSDPATLGEAEVALRKYSGTLKGTNEGGKASTEFADAITYLVQSKTVAQTFLTLSDHFDGLQKDYGKSEQDIFYADPPFLYLADLAERYGEDFNRFFRDIDRAVSTLARTLPDDEDDGKESEKAWKRRLHLMTALRAKGKEFDAVIMLDVNEGIWPSRLSRTEDQLEQERRVFYVGVTRARKRLYLNFSDSIQGQRTQPSQYLSEMGLRIPAVSN